MDFKNLKGELKGKYRIRKGRIRIIVTIKDIEEILEAIIEYIDFRGNVYKYNRWNNTKRNRLIMYCFRQIKGEKG